MASYKICLIGDGNTGKSFWLKKMRFGVMEDNGKYIPTLGAEVYPLTFNTNYGVITFNVWDCAGQEKFGGLRDGYYFHSQGAIIFGDNPKSLKKWAKDYTRVPGGYKYIEVFDAAYNKREIYPPLLNLAKKITKHNDLVFY